MAFDIHQDLGVHMSSRVFFVLPDAGVTIDSLRTITGKAPNPSWWVLCDVGGIGTNLGANAFASKRRMPSLVPELLGKVKQWAGTARTVIAIVVFSWRRLRIGLGLTSRRGLGRCSFDRSVPPQQQRRRQPGGIATVVACAAPNLAHSI